MWETYPDLSATADVFEASFCWRFLKDGAFSCALGNFTFWGMYSSFGVGEGSERELVWFKPRDWCNRFFWKFVPETLSLRASTSQEGWLEEKVFSLLSPFSPLHLQRSYTSYGLRAGASHLPWNQLSKIMHTSTIWPPREGAVFI